MDIRLQRITDDYDRRAFERILKEVEKERSAPGRVKKAITTTKDKVVDRVPERALEVTEAALQTAFLGLKKLTIEPAFRSVVRTRVVQSYQRKGETIRELEDIRAMPLRLIDDVMPPLRWRYAAAGAVEGAAAGAVITGGELLATFGSVAGAGVAAAPGAGTVIGTMAADSAAVLAALARVTAHVGAYYGYDTRLPEEQIYALAVVGWSSAGGGAAKTAAFQELSQITQQLVRRAAWSELSQHTLVQIIEKIYVKLGFNLTKEKLGQAIPIAGIVIGAGLNAYLLQSAGDAAQLAYRMRHLVEKYGLDDLGIGTPNASSSAAPVVGALDVSSIVAEVTAQAGGGGVYPFGRPVTSRPASADTPRPLFVLGAYPSALHVQWKPADGRLVRALPVDDEPEPFWNGAGAEARLEAWLDWLQPDPKVHGTFGVPKGLTGPSGQWVDDKVLQPLSQSRSTTWITDCLDTYCASDGVAKRIEDTYVPAGLPPCQLDPHPSENEIVREALARHRNRLLNELDRCRPETVVTLGNAAARVFADLCGLPATKLTVAGYGDEKTVQLGDRTISWLPLAHPAAPKQFQEAHDQWAEFRREAGRRLAGSGYSDSSR